MTDLLLPIIVAYLLGSIPFGLIFTRVLTGKDPRQHGSGNIGATNAMRTGGKRVGVLTLAADIAKGALPVAWAVHNGDEQLTAMMASAAFLGHIFPVWLKFRGGKGVATMFGVVIPWHLAVAAIAFGFWLLLFKISRYVSLASIGAAVALPVSAFALGGSMPMVAACSLFAALGIYRHWENIDRLRRGVEHRAGESSGQG